MPKYDIFLSHSSRYKYITAKIVHILEEQNYTVWWDTELTPAQEWRNEIEKKIQESHYFLYLLSPESIRSHYCQKEYNLAVDKSLKFIPVLIHPDAKTELPQQIGTIQLVDFTHNDTDKSEKDLITALEDAECLQPSHKLANHIFALYQLDTIANDLAHLFREYFIEYEIKKDAGTELTNDEHYKYASKMTYLHKQLEHMVAPNNNLSKLVCDMKVDIQTISGRTRGILEGSQSVEQDVLGSIEKALQKLSQLRWQ